MNMEGGTIAMLGESVTVIQARAAPALPVGSYPGLLWIRRSNLHSYRCTQTGAAC